MPCRRDCEMPASSRRRLFDRSDQINQNSRGISVPPQGCWVKRNRRPSLYNVERSANLPFAGKISKLCLFAFTRMYHSGAGNHRAQPNQKKKWWSLTGSNRRHPACKAGALPAELRPHSLTEPDNGWPGQTRTADLTLIRRAL